MKTGKQAADEQADWQQTRQARVPHTIIAKQQHFFYYNSAHPINIWQRVHNGYGSEFKTNTYCLMRTVLWYTFDIFHGILSVRSIYRMKAYSVEICRMADCSTSGEEFVTFSAKNL